MAATVLTPCCSKAISEAGTLPERLSSARCWTHTFSGAVNLQLKTRDKSGFARATLASAPPLATRADGLTAWGSQSKAQQIIYPTSRKTTTGNTKQAIPTIPTYMVLLILGHLPRSYLSHHQWCTLFRYDQMIICFITFSLKGHSSFQVQTAKSTSCQSH